MYTYICVYIVFAMAVVPQIAFRLGCVESHHVATILNWIIVTVAFGVCCEGESEA